MATIESNSCINFSISNGIITGKYKMNAIIGLMEAKEAVRNRIKLAQNTPMPILIDGRSLFKITKEARDYFSSEEGSELLSAAALIVDSSLTKMLANFFIRINIKKPLIPIKLFSDEQEAIKWLEEYK